MLSLFPGLFGSDAITAQAGGSSSLFSGHQRTPLEASACTVVGHGHPSTQAQAPWTSPMTLQQQGETLMRLRRVGQASPHGASPFGPRGPIASAHRDMPYPICVSFCTSY